MLVEVAFNAFDLGGERTLKYWRVSEVAALFLWLHIFPNSHLGRVHFLRLVERTKERRKESERH